MKKSNTLIATILLAGLFVTMSACSNASDDTSSMNLQAEERDNKSENTNDSSPLNDSTTDSSPTEPINDTMKNENILEDNITKIEGRKREFLDKLDQIQKELDALPEKKDSDQGVTGAMKSYYGISYETYDKALNEIYALLKEKLSSETMENLRTKQLKWIEEKEEKAIKAAEEFKGGTFENVAYYISLYESTKEKCYELVHEYMTDPNIKDDSTKHIIIRQ
ncbi:lysozyme inhibitor LprI family protein [Marinicrinis lubricantis]|uniref:Lysozyme inhibitor LprI family protein n=1 Tax=Marinicrinis lubricantis TaxID=2086470 RepID=A0ABW1IPF2_9BACL